MVRRGHDLLHPYSIMALISLGFDVEKIAGVRTSWPASFSIFGMRGGCPVEGIYKGTKRGTATQDYRKWAKCSQGNRDGSETYCPE
jgi:hypothetical protein